MIEASPIWSIFIGGMLAIVVAATVYELAIEALWSSRMWRFRRRFRR